MYFTRMPATLLLILFAALFIATPWASTARQMSSLTDADVQRILDDRINRNPAGLAIIAGMVRPTERRFVSRAGNQGATQISRDSVFEIGSVTKVMTAWLLADMSRRGEVGLLDSVERLLPPGARPAPTSSGRAITLADLATHTAGMPFWPSNLATAGDHAGALEAYREADLFRFLGGFRTPESVGTQWAYSNVDSGLLGVLLGRQAGLRFEQLLATRLTAPLKMTRTAVIPTAEMSSLMVSGHDARMRPAPRWNVPALAAGGSLHSTAGDLLNLLEAMTDPRSKTGAALPIMLGTRRQAPGFQQALGWMIVGPPGNEILFHDGQTLGFASAIALDPQSRTGVVVLANAAIPIGDIARHILRPAIPLTAPVAPAPQKTEIAIDPTLLDRYAGEYEPKAGIVFGVTHEGDALMLQIPGLPKMRLRPERDREFFVAENTRITVAFEVDGTGEVTRMLFRAPGADVPAARIRR